MKTRIPPTPITNPLWRMIVVGVSSGLGLGFMPIAPGTFGSLLGIPLGLALLELELLHAALVCLALFALFAWLAEKACRHWGEMDSGRVVSDEVLGQAIAIAALKTALIPGGWQANVGLLVASFLLFRAFDILKPFPARTFDRQGTGFGVVADDVVAGVYAALVLQLVARIWLKSAAI